jgi:chlorite dismutase
MAERTLNHFAFFAFTEAYWTLDTEQRAAFRSSLLEGLRAAASQVDVYQVFPARAEHDFVVWSALPAEEGCNAATFFEGFARAVNPHRRLIRPVNTLWGFTKPSQYSKGRSPQEIDPFATERKRYLVGYPFVKTMDWYLMSRDARQGMMNEHIRVGHQYPEIKQLLLYSFGLQDQEFIVVYETDDLAMFSDLVNELRATEARRYTERDTPIFTAVYHQAETTLGLWE